MSQELENFLEQVRVLDKPPDALRAHHQKLVMQALSSAPVAGSDTPPALGKGAAEAFKTWAASRPVLALVALAVGYGAGTLSSRSVRNRDPEPVANLAPLPNLYDGGVADVGAVDALAVPDSTLTARAWVVNPRRSESREPDEHSQDASIPMAPVDSPMLAEVQALRAIENALRADRFAVAATLLQDHRARFPESTFAEERDGLAVILSCRQQLPSSAERRAAFATRYPDSAMRARIAAACAAIDTP